MFCLKKLNNEKGITLLEVLVSTGIFLVLISLVVGVFINSRRTIAGAKSRDQANNYLTQTMEYLVRIVKESTIDYSSSNYDLPTSMLFIIKEQEKITISKKEKCSLGFGCIEINNREIEDKNINIKELNFYVAPLSANNNQGLITIVMVGQVVSEKNIQEKPIILQTTISSRVYKR